MIVWINGTHGVGKTTLAPLVQARLPGSRVFDAEQVGVLLMGITPQLSDTDNFQHWPPWRALVVDTARRVLDHAGGTLVVPMTVLVEQYWREISDGLAGHGIAVQHIVLHADAGTLRRRIDDDAVMGPSRFRHRYVEQYLDAARRWLHGAADAVIDTTRADPEEVAQQVVDALRP